MVGQDFHTTLQRRRQQYCSNRLWRLSLTGFAVGAMAALGAITILGMLGAL